MLNKKYELIACKDCRALIREVFIPGDSEIDEGEPSLFEIDGSGRLVIRNTGGSSASEGGMGTGGGEEKGPGISTEEVNKTGSKPGKAVDDGGWDPLKPKEEKGKVKD